MKRSFIVLLLTAISVLAFAQSRQISGQIIDKETKEGMVQATVHLLKPDSTFVKGVLTDLEGNFALEVPENGKYIVKMTNVGYITETKNISVSGDKDVKLGILTLTPDAILLKEATVTGQAAKVTVRKDTFVYNADAYRTAEGSVVEELVKKLPGAQVDDDGKITINGKEVKKI